MATEEPEKKQRAAGGGKRDPKKEFTARKPAPDVVGDFHQNCDVDAHAQAMHHTLGFGSSQAASGDHRHDASAPDSVPLWTGVNLSGVSGSSSTSELAAAISALQALIMQKATG